jgi:hypothetical protein
MKDNRSYHLEQSWFLFGNSLLYQKEDKDRRMMSLRVLTMAVCFVVFAADGISNANAAVYYVAPNGSDSNVGSEVSPFRTIQRAADIVRAGDTVIVEDGTYIDSNSDNKLLYINTAGSSGNPITFRAANKWEAKLDGRDGTTNYGVYFGNNASYIIVEGFEIYGTNYGGFWSNGTGHHLTIVGNNIHHHGKNLPPEDANGATGVYLGNNGPSSGYVTIDSNSIHHIGRDGWPDPDIDDDHGVYVRQPRAYIFNNIFYENNSGMDVVLKDVGNEGGDHCTVINNTFGKSSAAKPLLGRVLCMYGLDDVKIENNIFHSGNNSYAIGFYTPGETEYYSNFYIRNNLTYGMAGLHYPITLEGTGFTISGNIENTDPLFLDYSTYDYHLQSGSPAIDACHNYRFNSDLRLQR